MLRRPLKSSVDPPCGQVGQRMGLWVGGGGGSYGVRSRRDEAEDWQERYSANLELKDSNIGMRSVHYRYDLEAIIKTVDTIAWFLNIFVSKPEL